MLTEKQNHQLLLDLGFDAPTDDLWDVVLLRENQENIYDFSAYSNDTKGLLRKAVRIYCQKVHDEEIHILDLEDFLTETERSGF